MKKRDEEKDPYALKDIFVDMEMDLVLSFKRNLTKHHTDEINKGFSWEMWQVAMLRNIEEYRKENQQIIGKYRPAVKAVVDDVLNYKYEEGQRNVEKQAKRTKQSKTQEPETGQIDMDHGSFSLPENERNTGKVGNTPPKETQFFGMNKKKLNALISSTQKDMEDVCQAVYRKMNDVYRQTIYKAVIQLNSGAISLNKAIDKATEEFLGKGIDSVVYKNGRHVNIATYAEMALRTASQRATFLGEGSKRDEYGNYLIVVSTHPNCCKLCYPWQGQILIDDVFSHPNDDYISKYKGKYKLLSSAMKAGLSHPNCRHTLATWFEGISRLPKIYDEEEANKEYHAEQKQRALENAIRKAKRQKAGAMDKENKDKATKKVLALQKQLREHLKAHPELKRNPYREKKETAIEETIIAKEDDGLNVKKFKNIPSESKFPKEFDYPEPKKTNINNTKSKLLENGKRTGNEYVSINDFVTGKELSKIHTDNKPSSSTPSWKMIRILRSSPDNSITFVHNHPKSTSFSVADVLMMAKAKSIKEIIALGHDGTEYYISINKSDKIVLSIASNIEIFKNDVQNRRKSYRDKGYSPSEAKHIVWEEIANERGWSYGKRSK